MKNIFGGCKVHRKKYIGIVRGKLSVVRTQSDTEKNNFFKDNTHKVENKKGGGGTMHLKRIIRVAFFSRTFACAFEPRVTLHLSFCLFLCHIRGAYIQFRNYTVKLKPQLGQINQDLFFIFLPLVKKKIAPPSRGL